MSISVLLRNLNVNIPQTAQMQLEWTELVELLSANITSSSVLAIALTFDAKVIIV